jgi:hypothetical protein
MIRAVAHFCRSRSFLRKLRLNRDQSAPKRLGRKTGDVVIFPICRYCRSSCPSMLPGLDNACWWLSVLLVDRKFQEQRVVRARDIRFRSTKSGLAQPHKSPPCIALTATRAEPEPSAAASFLPHHLNIQCGASCETSSLHNEPRPVELNGFSGSWPLVFSRAS